MIKEIKALDEVIEDSNSKEIEILMELLENKKQYAAIVLKVKECEEAEDRQRGTLDLSTIDQYNEEKAIREGQS